MKLVMQTIIRFLMIDKGLLHRLNQLPIVSRMRRWVQFASNAAVATVLMTMAALAANVLVFRVIPPVQAGQFALLVAISQILSLLAGMGQPILIRRHYAREPLGHFNWLHDLSRTFIIVAPVALAASAVAVYLYKFEFSYGLVIFCAVLSYASINVCSHILASQRHYVSSNVVLRLPNLLLLLVGLLIVLLPEPERFSYLLIGYVSLMTLTVLTALLILRQQVPRGAAHITWGERKQGAAFVVSNLSYQLPEEGLLSLAGLLVSSGQIAAVSALSLFLRPFGTIYDILNHILLTELARREQIHYRQMAWTLLALTAVMAIGAVVLLPFVSSWLYAGRYDAFHYLIPLLVGSVALQLVEVLPRTHIMARGNNQTVNRFITFTTTGTVLGAGITLLFILQFGITGLALGTMLLYCIRVAISAVFSRTVLALPHLAADANSAS
jgi:O-antigen/teichoic acid export membrane protein